jgi:hypothetical protein
MENRPHQRKGSESNAKVGADFQVFAQEYFRSASLVLQADFAVECGVQTKRKKHKFDLGSDEPRVLVECKSHTWTEGKNVPSAKMTTWNEAMLYFLAAPKDYRKVLFVLRDICLRRNVSLLSYYLRTYAHLVPPGVEFMEFDPATKVVTLVPLPK